MKIDKCATWRANETWEMYEARIERAKEKAASSKKHRKEGLVYRRPMKDMQDD